MGIASSFRQMVGLERKSQELRADDEKATRIWGRALGLWGDTYVNKPVTVDGALQLATVWACVRLISETVATLPLMLYRRGPDNGRSVASDHPLYAILHDSPNADHTAVEFLEGLVLSLCLWGNAYAAKLTIGSRLIGLEPLRADLMSVVRDQDGNRRYRYADRGKMVVFEETEIFHVRGFGAAGDVGLSPIAFARQTLGAAMAADEASARIFANGVRPSGILTIDQVLTKEQRAAVKDNIIQPLAGASNAGSMFVLEAGMKFQPVSLSPEDSQMLMTRAFHVEEICRWYRVPPVLAGHASAGQTMFGAGVEQIMLGWLTLGLRAYLTRIEQAVRRDLIAPVERAEIYAEFNIEALLRADSAGRAELYSKMAQNGIYTRNEIRARENLSSVPGGDTITVQSNLLPIDLLGKVAQLPNEKPIEPGAATGPADPPAGKGGGPTGRTPFDEAKAFDPGKHPRGPDGRWTGAGGSGRRAARLARDAIADRGHRDDVDLGRVPGHRFSAHAGRDVDGWRFALTSDGARHTHLRHGPGSADRKPLGHREFRNLPRVLARGHVTRGGVTRGERLSTVIVAHPVRGETYRAVLTVRKRNRTLTLQTFSKVQAGPSAGKS